MIEVCCAIIVNGTKILAVQRGPKSSHPLLWEFPGGKIYQYETAEQCIVREIQEELTVEIETSDRFEAVDFNYGTKQIHLIPFICRIVSGEIRLTEHIAQRWIGINEWEMIEWSGADRELILKNQEKIYSLLIGNQE
jgi:8-oxo-dGTP diphosphatase